MAKKQAKAKSAKGASAKKPAGSKAPKKAAKTKAPAKKTSVDASKVKPMSRPPIRAALGKPPVTVKTKPASKQKLTKKFLEVQRHRLLDLRDHILDQMQGVAQDSLRTRAEGSEASAFGMHQADAGSDAYEKDFALSLLSQEQDSLYEIEEGLKRIEDGTYGICEMSGEVIPVERLEAMPFARMTIECQQKLERENRGRRRWDTAPQFMESTDNFYEEEDDGDDEERVKIKEA